MTLDLSPAAGPAPRGVRIRRHAAMEAALTLRNGEQLLLALVFPLLLLLGGLLLGGRFGLDVTVFPASVLALVVWSTSFTSLAITTGYERRYGVLERLAATPLRRGDLVAGKALANASIVAGQLALLAGAALLAGWRPHPAPLGTLAAVVGVALAAVTFASWALALAGRLRAEATLALANLLYVLVAAGGALLAPLAAYPRPVSGVLRLLPPAALGELLRGWSAGATPWWPLPVLAVWAAASLLLARKAFRWIS